MKKGTDTILNISLNDLMILLNDQKKITGEKICRQFNEGDSVDKSVIRNSAVKSDFPNDITVIKKYLLNDTK